MLKRIYILSLLWISIAACSNKSDSIDDKELPVIQLLSPTANQVFTAGQTVIVGGNITDNNKLAEIHVHIYNNTSGQLLMDIHRFPVGGTYALNETFTVQAGIQYKIQVLATDKSANQQNQTVFISAN
ncbi:MAG: DUF4625 domain-containing protein [Chitinophagaceae bacterium]